MLDPKFSGSCVASAECLTTKTVHLSSEKEHLFEFKRDDLQKADICDDDFEFDFQSTQKLGKQLIQGYAQFIATTYLTFSSLIGMSIRNTQMKFYF